MGTYQHMRMCSEYLALMRKSRKRVNLDDLRYNTGPEGPEREPQDRRQRPDRRRDRGHKKEVYPLSSEIRNYTVAAVGRYKSATARAFVTRGEGNVTVSRRKKNRRVGLMLQENSRPLKKQALEGYLQGNREYINEVEGPLKLFKTKYDAVVIVSGGGIKGQARAIKLAISRAVIKFYLRGWVGKVKGEIKIQDLVNEHRLSGGENRVELKYLEKILSYKKLFKSLGYLTQDSR